MNEIGLTIVFDGKNNVVMGDGEAKEYPIGGVACVSMQGSIRTR